jgi:hypothetical protein
VEAEWHVVVGVQAGRNDDVQFGGLSDAGNARDVAAQPDDGQVHDGVHSGRLECVQPRDGVGFARVVVSPLFGVVLHDLGRHDEDMLMHERDAQTRGVNRTSHRIHLWHNGITR